MRGSSQDCISMRKVALFLFEETADQRKKIIQQLWDGSVEGANDGEVQGEVRRFDAEPSELTVEDVHLLQYRGLQNACKVLKLAGAKSKTDKLRERLPRRSVRN